MQKGVQNLPCRPRVQLAGIIKAQHLHVWDFFCWEFMYIPEKLQPMLCSQCAGKTGQECTSMYVRDIRSIAPMKLEFCRDVVGTTVRDWRRRRPPRSRRLSRRAYHRGGARETERDRFRSSDAKTTERGPPSTMRM